ncbi:MAG: hypothetical protein HYW48_02460 [Deltaproteobacteria bacterium]|nr:hypothetical protein [Deltaproteobacteria bacterium]
MSNPIKRWTDLHIALFEQRILLIVVSIAALILIITDRVSLNELQTKLREKEYILAPGVMDFAKVNPGVISHDYVREFVESLSLSLGCFGASDIETRHRGLEKYMADDFRIRFRETTKKDLTLFTSNDVAELFSVKSTEIIEKDSGFEAVVKGTQTRFVSGLKVFEGPHVFIFSLKAVAPSSASPWALEIKDITRLSEEDFQNLKRSVK